MNRTDFIKKNMKGVVLDIGCSEGSLHEKIFTENVYGLDIKIGQNRKNFVKGNAMFIPFQDDKFDTIIAGELIEHLQDPERFLRECKRVLKKNGFLILTTPNKNSWVNRILKSYQHDVHISLFDKDSFRKLVSKHFSEERFFSLPYNEVSSWGSRHKSLFWLRKIIHHFLPQDLQEEMIIKSVNNK